MMRAGTALFATRILVVDCGLGFAVEEGRALDKTIDFGFARVVFSAFAGEDFRLAGKTSALLFRTTGFAFDAVFVFALLFDFTAMYFSILLCHFIGNILLKTLAHAFKRNALEDRVEESLHDDFFRLSLRDTARFQIKKRFLF